MQQTVGFALAKPAEVLGAEPYMHELIAGIERVLLPRSASLLLRIVSSPSGVADTIRRWSADGLVDAVILMDLEPDDAAVALVRELAIPAVVSGDPDTAAGLSTVWSQDDLVMDAAVDAMLRLGHRRLAQLTGPGRMAHTRLRLAAFERAARAAGAEAVAREGDYSERSGRELALELLRDEQPPTAIVADNDLMAIGALAAARELGVEVPAQLSIVAWDDSPLCQLSSPPLSAMSHDVQTIGELIAEVALEAIDGEPARVVRAPVAEFVARGSTASPPIPSAIDDGSDADVGGDETSGP
ncbi:LacI family DNA-binding transcriptional regulator [Agromyces larvae]|uniref:Substrate-binding domain-containing protein n=1 Tax=Agromyces larvae TaxID=2929802 RepID=A0ABY4C3U0_9MICO|nr:substrate-binding domain-containing protein [Agromyces larvae]UOE44836.1 substrate-binding domain-containing protein [Agromyces larvae]